MESHSDKFRIVLCVDMDAFYAQCEAVRLGIDPTAPLAVRQWEALIAVNYAARQRGINKMSNCFEASKACPEIKMIHVDTIRVTPDGKEIRSTIEDKFKTHDRVSEKVSLEYYRSESVKIIDVFKRYCKTVEKASIDEAFFDITEEIKTQLEEQEHSRNWTNEWTGVISGGEPFIPNTFLEKGLMLASEFASKIRQEVYDALKYTCSAGISYNKMLAKLASGLNKPNKQTIITPRYCISSLANLEVKKIRNFGGKVQSALKERGIETLGKVQELGIKELSQIVKDEGIAKWIYFRCRGFDDENVEQKKIDNKSLLSNKSFSSIFDMKKLMGMVELVIADLNSRVNAFYEETGYVPQTMTLNYFDRQVKLHKSKSGPINLLCPKSHFKKNLLSKCIEMIKSLEKVFFPCTILSVSVRNFCRNDIKNYEFDLVSFFKKKEAESTRPEDSNFTNDLVMTESNTEGILPSECLVHNDITTNKLEFENFESNNEQFNQPQEQILHACDKCGKSIASHDIESHMDFHVAEDLDREMNPHKRKYNMKRNSLEMESENGNKPNVDKKTELERASPPTKALKTSVDKGSIKPGNNQSKITIKPINSYFRKHFIPESHSIGCWTIKLLIESSIA